MKPTWLSITLGTCIILVEGSSLHTKLMSNDWSDNSYLDQEYDRRDFNLKPQSFNIVGFSSGAYATSNLFAMYNR